MSLAVCVVQFLRGPFHCCKRRMRNDLLRSCANQKFSDLPKRADAWIDQNYRHMPDVTSRAEKGLIGRKPVWQVIIEEEIRCGLCLQCRHPG